MDEQKSVRATYLRLDKKSKMMGRVLGESRLHIQADLTGGNGLPPGAQTATLPIIQQYLFNLCTYNYTENSNIRITRNLARSEERSTKFQLQKHLSAQIIVAVRAEIV
jgi:hypothetical protein